MANKFCINWAAFIFAFAIGLMYVYISSPPQKVVLKYPTPYNAGKVIYHDAADNCFVFDAKKVECPKDKSIIKPQPIQTENKI